MKRVIKCISTLIAFAAIAGGVYFFLKNKTEKEDDFDDFDDFDDTDEEEKEESNEEEERGYVTLNLHQDQGAE